MPELLAWIQASALGVAVRGSGVWTYAFLNLFHIFGVSTLFGSVLILDLQLLRLSSGSVIATVSRTAVPLAKAGFAVAALTGAAMLATNATEYTGNPFLLVKFPAIALGILNVTLLSRMPAWKAHRSRELTRGEQVQLAVMGGISLASWVTAVAAGRMIGYW